jgi:CHAT domain-containing protein
MERFIRKLPEGIVYDRVSARDKLEKWNVVKNLLPRLGPGVVALFTLVAVDKYYVILVTPEGPQRFNFPIDHAALRTKVVDFRAKLEDRCSNPLPEAKEMYGILVGPEVQEALNKAGATTLLWSFDWVLRYIPVTALHDGDQYLAERYLNAIFTPDYLSPLHLDRQSTKWEGVGLGVSNGEDALNALPAVSEELRGIFSGRAPGANAPPVPEGVAMQGRILLDDDFTMETLMEELLEQRPVVHIASHFVFVPGDEEKSYLLLGKGQRLSLTQIKEKLSFEGVDLLTLSACNTASGGDGKGDEIEGFAQSAQRLSARAVMASLWAVADAGTSRLMLGFYRYRAGHSERSKAEALQQAQLALLRNPTPVAESNSDAKRTSSRLKKGGGAQCEGTNNSHAHPYYWAPFLLIGDWR